MVSLNQVRQIPLESIHIMADHPTPQICPMSYSVDEFLRRRLVMQVSTFLRSSL
jgi:hypothetical protein